MRAVASGVLSRAAIGGRGGSGCARPALLLALAFTLAAPFSMAGTLEISDDFENVQPGTFPPQWLDAGRVDPESDAPDPSSVVVQTIDPVGMATRALAIRPALASQGIYQHIPVSTSVSISVDLRVLAFSGGGPSTSQQFVSEDFPIDITLSQLRDDVPLSFVPSMGIFISSLTESWFGYVVGTDSADFFPDYGVPVRPGVWYRVELELDPVNGVMDATVTELPNGLVVLDRIDMIPGWTPADGLFDAVSFFEDELSQTPSPNVILLDNIRVMAQFDDAGD